MRVKVWGFRSPIGGNYLITVKGVYELREDRVEPLYGKEGDPYKTTIEIGLVTYAMIRRLEGHKSIRVGCTPIYYANGLIFAKSSDDESRFNPHSKSTFLTKFNRNGERVLKQFGFDRNDLAPFRRAHREFLERKRKSK